MKSGLRPHPSPDTCDGSHQRGWIMCMKGEKQAKGKPGNFRCKKCGATARKKGKLCKPKKIK